MSQQIENVPDLVQEEGEYRSLAESLARACAFGGNAITFTILGEPASKANSREIVQIAGRPSSIKSAKARNYERDALKQIPPSARVQMQGPVAVTIRVFYATERPDLDESVILDVLQDRYKSEKVGNGKVRVLVQKGVYLNDRQVREKHIYHAIDRKNPRAEITVQAMQAQQPDLLAPTPGDLAAGVAVHQAMREPF